MSQPAMSRRLLIALLAPLALALVLCLVVQPEPGALVAPLLGPWAGLAWGHSECTMAKALPGPSYATVVALSVVLWLYLRAHASRGRAVLAALLFIAVLSWSALAVLSALNAAM